MQEHGHLQGKVQEQWQVDRKMQERVHEQKQWQFKARQQQKQKGTSGVKSLLGLPSLKHPSSCVVERGGREVRALAAHTIAHYTAFRKLRRWDSSWVGLLSSKMGVKPNP